MYIVHESRQVFTVDLHLLQTLASVFEPVHLKTKHSEELRRKQRLQTEKAKICVFSFLTIGPVKPAVSHVQSEKEEEEGRRDSVPANEKKPASQRPVN